MMGYFMMGYFISHLFSPFEKRGETVIPDARRKAIPGVR
jgi:hypothetical protein